MSNDLMTIREMSDAFNVTLRLLRFYEEKELLFPIREGHRRLFDKRSRARLKLILRGQSYGFKLEEMRHLLDLYDQGKKYEQLIEVHKSGVTYLKDLKTERWRLEETIADLELRLFQCAEELDARSRQNAAVA